MLSPTQILLIVVVSILTVGIQIFLILKEGRRSVEKVNKILDDAGTLSSSVTKPISSLFNSFGGFSGFSGILGWLINRKKKKQEEEEQEKRGKKDE